MDASELMLLSDQEKDTLMRMALGRLFLLGSRPFQPGDLEAYHACRDVIMTLGSSPGLDTRPNWARDRNRGAAGG